MKKTYIKPTSISVGIQGESFIALSIQGPQIESGNKDQFEQLGRDDQPSSPSVWEQGW